MTDRPAHSEDEVEVTPDMIEAGMQAFIEYDPRVEGRRAIVEHIYREMTILWFNQAAADPKTIPLEEQY